MRALLLLLLVGCTEPVITETMWKVAEYKCANNGGPKEIKVWYLWSEGRHRLLIHCHNGMWGEALVIDRREDGN